MLEFFRKYVFANAWLKLVSLALAVLLWWGVSHDPTVEAVVTAPVEFHHAPQDLEMSVESTPQIRVRVRGPERRVRTLNASDIQAIVDLSGAHVGERTFDLTAQQVRVPRDVEVVQIEPSQVHISFDRSATRTVTVRPRVIGNLVTGYHITAVTAAPDQINVIGPAHRVEQIADAITDPVDATGVMGSATFTTHAYVTDPLVRVQRPTPIHVTVTTSKTPQGADSH